MSDRVVSERNEMNGRRAYIFRVFAVFILLPLSAEIIGNAIGYDFGSLSSTIKVDSAGNQIAQGFSLNVLSTWYISVPLFIYFTYKRVTDTNLNPWFTVLFVLPLINLIIWFWPPGKKNS